MLRVLVAGMIACLAFVSGGHPAEARDRQAVIGTGSVEANGTTLTIDVSKAKGAYKGIRVRAKQGPIDFTGIRIVYEDDTFHLIEKQFQLKRGEQTKILDPVRNDRFVDTVVLSTKGPASAMEVEVIGVQSRDGARRERPRAPVEVAVPAPAAPAAPAQPGAAPQPPAQAAPPPPPPKAVFADPATIAEGRDVMFGYGTAALSIDKQVIPVGAQTGKFHALRLKVTGSDLFITRLEVRYFDDTIDVMTLDALVKANQRTKWLKINGDRFIKEIEVSYRAKSGSKSQARVEVIGQYSEGWLAQNGEGRKYNDGWVLLGSQTAGSIGFDKDVISVGKNEGGFSKLRLKVKDRSITLREIRVAYFNGPDETIKTNERLDPDQVAGPWDLKVGNAPIKEIVAVYRRRMIFGKGQGSAVVEFWGQH